MLTFLICLCFVVVIRSQSVDYCRINAANTLCLNKPGTFGPSCGQVTIAGLSDDDKELIVNYHNELRRRVATGLEDRGSPGPQPPAANMRQMVWDDELSVMAQTHAQQCQFRHDSNRDVDRFKVGQNIAMAISTSSSVQIDWKQQINNWYSEVDRANQIVIQRFPRSSKSIGHYTQILWANSYALGCGLVGYYEKRAGGVDRWHVQFYVCNYGPAGNYIDQPVYKIGPAASQCPSGTSPADGLCL